MDFPERLTTERLLLRRPVPEDAQAIFEEYAGDAAIGRFIAWPIHRSIEDTQQYLAFSASEWRRWRVGPYLIFDRDESTLMGSTGLAFESDEVASTGYVIARNYWGRGYATEALRAIVELANRHRLSRLYALCHPDHHRSQRVLKKCGFENEGIIEGACVFPNQGTQEPQNVFRFVWTGLAD